MKILSIFLLCATVSAVFAQQDRVVGIIPFSNEGNGRYQWLSRGFESLLYDNLSEIPNIMVFERETLKRVLKQLDVTSARVVTPKKAFSIGKASGIEVLFIGDYRVNGNDLTVNFRLVSTYTGAAIYTHTYKKPLNQVFDITKEMIKTSLSVMQLPLSGKAEAAISRKPTSSVKAFESFCKAYVELDRESPMEVIAGYFQRALQQDPNYWEARYNLGVIYYNFRLYQKAMEQFNTVIKQYPENYNPYYGKGVIYYLKRDYPRALREFKKALRLNPEHDRSYYYSGIVYTRMDSLKKGMKALQKSIEINPNYAPAYFQLGLSEMRRGWFKQAIQSLTKATRLNNEFYQANNALGEAYYALNLFEEAIIEFNKAIKLKPNYATAYFNLGNAIYKKGALEEIVDAFWSLIEVQYQPEGTNGIHPTPIDDLKKLRKKSHIEDASQILRKMVRAYRTALKYDKRFYEASYNLALAYEHLNKPDSAQYFYKVAISQKNDLAQAHMRLGKLYEKKKQYDLALKEFRSVVKIEPDYFTSNPRLGEPYRYINIVDEVLKEQLSILKTDPRNSKALEIVGKIYLSMGRLGQAEQYYTQLLELKPNDYLAKRKLHEIRRRLRKM